MSASCPKPLAIVRKLNFVILHVMATDIKVCSASGIIHRQTCVLHDDEQTSICSGTLKNGGNCSHKATGPPVAHMMPTCKIHRDQLKVSGWCRATLPCGFECGRLFNWKPYGFQLCSGHREYSMTCYFLKIPVELRLRVYQFLLPDRPIPARFWNSRELTTDSEKVCTAILRVNHQIHDEVAGLLYGTRVFTIELSGHSLSMCNSTGSLIRHGVSCRSNSNVLQVYQAQPMLSQQGISSRGNHALQDYQMQLMLLEQQNKRRVMIARTSNPTLPNIQLGTRSVIPHQYREIELEPVWSPPLSERYFNMIQFFLIKIEVSSSMTAGATNHQAHLLSNENAANEKAFELMLYDCCDSLHGLIGRIQLIQRPIANIVIAIEFYNADMQRDEVFFAAKLLLQPFRRLHDIVRPEVLSITTSDAPNLGKALLMRDWISSATDETFADYLKCWSRDLSNPQPSFECPQVLEAYWKLEKLLFRIENHCPNANPKICQFGDLLHAARIAREADDLAHFKEIWDRVVNIWLDIVESQRDFESNVEQSINAIYDIVKEDSRMMT